MKRMSKDNFADEEVRQMFEKENYTDDELKYLFRLLPIKSRLHKGVIYVIQNGVINKIETR